MSREDLGSYAKYFKVYADIGPTDWLMSRVLSTLHTSVGPKLVRTSEPLAGMETLVSFGPTQDIGDANNKPLRTLGTIKMPVRLEKFVAAAEFIVCEKLAVPFILGADYCDQFVEAISSRRKKVYLAAFSEVPIVRRFSPRKAKKNLVPGEDEDGEKGERISPKVKVAKATIIEPGTQRVVECTSKKTGLVVVQPYSPLYDRHRLICTNGVVQIEPYRLFRLPVANLGSTPSECKKAKWRQNYYYTRGPCLRVKPPLVKFSQFRKGRRKCFLILLSRVRARQDANHRIKAAKTSQENGRQGSPRRRLRSRNAGLSRHRRTWRNST